MSRAGYQCTMSAYIMLFAAYTGLVKAQWHPPTSGPNTVEVNNTLFATYILVSLACVALAAIVYRTWIRLFQYIRTLTCLTNDGQEYFRRPTTALSTIKEYLFDAPLFRTRHHQEIRLFRRRGMGVIPTRLQSIILTGIIGMNIALAVVGIEWHEPSSVNTLKHFRNRTGTLAVVNMIPLVILAGRNNPLISLLGVSYDTFNLFHRWFGRICAAEVVTHFAAYLAADYYLEGWAETMARFGAWSTNVTGAVALGAMLTITIQSLAVIRRAFYELFYHLHVLLAMTVVGALWYHLADSPVQKTYLIAVIALWAIERTLRLVRIAYRNFGSQGMSRAKIEVLPGDAIRVTFSLARPWTFKPGQHFFVTMPAIGLWTSHPFSAAWSDESPVWTDEKGLALTQQDLVAQTKTTQISAVIRGRHGFTQKLLQRATASSSGLFHAAAVLEGPYGLANPLASYGTVVLIAGGVGITHQVPYLRSLVNGCANGTVAARRVCLVWVIRSPNHVEWIRPWLAEVLALPRRRDVLRVQLFVTQPQSTEEVHSPNDTLQILPGRPNIDAILDREIATRVGAMAVSMCGPGSLADDVRRAVRQRHAAACIDLLEETFSW